jgi:glycosyltransferase involved in cell wall biosynthesis
MSRKLRFSVVIPTRNREQTLKHALRTCLDQIDFDDYEIVVNDNSDGDDTQALAAQLIAEDPQAKGRLRYNRRAAACSMALNFEDAISHAEGEYIIVIGDDDGLLPRALKELDGLIEQTGAAIVKWSPGLYAWPDLALPMQGGYLRVGLERAFRIASGAEELAKALERLSYDNLPSLYLNTAIKRSRIERFRDGEGHLFRSYSPGAYSAVTVSYACGDFIETTIPFTLDGLSGFSTRVSNAYAGANPAPRADLWRLSGQDGIKQHPHVPVLPIFPLVDFADGFLYAKDRYFSADDSFALPRERILRACIERCDTTDAATRKELLRTCRDDAGLTRFAKDLLAATPPTGQIPIRPRLGSSGRELNLDGTEFGLTTIRDAVALAHKVIWPAGAPLRYDLQATAAV